MKLLILHLFNKIYTSLPHNNHNNQDGRPSWYLGTHPVNRVSGRVRSSNQELVDLIRCAGLPNHATFEIESDNKPIL